MGYRIKVRFDGERSYRFVGGNGSTSRLVMHAAVWESPAKAWDLAEDILDTNPNVKAVRVVLDNGKVYLSKGDPVPPRAEFSFREYKYLVSIRNNRGTFEVKDDDGRWGHVTSDIYSECHAEAKRAGIRSDRMTIRGSICSIITDGLTFSQQINRYVEAG